jgi:large subunit ribosomal protein L14e
MEIGQLCVKLAGRDAGRVCVVVDQVDKNLVLVDGNVRRRKCNVVHLEPLADTIKIKKGASHSDVAAEFKKIKLDVWNTKSKSPKPRLVQQRKQPAQKSEVKSVEKKEVPKAQKKESKPKSEVPAKKSARKE